MFPFSNRNNYAAICFRWSRPKVHVVQHRYIDKFNIYCIVSISFVITKQKTQPTKINKELFQYENKRWLGIRASQNTQQKPVTYWPLAKAAINLVENKLKEPGKNRALMP